MHLHYSRYIIPPTLSKIIEFFMTSLELKVRAQSLIKCRISSFVQSANYLVYLSQIIIVIFDLLLFFLCQIVGAISLQDVLYAFLLFKAHNRAQS